MNSNKRRRTTLANDDIAPAMPLLVMGKSCQVKYQEKNKTKWYAGVIQTIGHKSIQVKFMYDGSVVELDQDVLCNNRRFKVDLHPNC
mmetsp:Transcript_26938/g.36999  ORF Transcript_26938/g.36999 Transcript_26938/m.36999 type:complete len:87 (+) Transcript_26938:1722-1982(+)